MKQTRVTIWPSLPEGYSWPAPLRSEWRKAIASDSLIPLTLALEYLRRNRKETA
jgi:hypothetical protein